LPFRDPTPAKLAEVDPTFRRRVVGFVNAVRGAGVPLIVISGFRSVEQQRALIAAGRTTATRSRHLEGRAVDVQWAGLLSTQVPGPWWDWIGSVGEHFGLRWGGRFGRIDINHFDAG